MVLGSRVKSIGPVDAGTYVKAIQVIALARNRGLDVVEELNRAGLLLTPERDKRIRTEVFTYVLERMDDLKPHEFLRRKYKQTLEQKTPSDLYECIKDWIGDLREWVKSGGGGSS